jgi:hypothetical protein
MALLPLSVGSRVVLALRAIKPANRPDLDRWVAAVKLLQINHAAAN